MLFILMIIIPMDFDKIPKTKISDWEKSETTEKQDKPKTNTIKIDINETLRIKNNDTEEIEEVSQRDYVIGAVCAEMPPSFHKEALKAQAVASHTYALYNKSLSKNKDFNFTANPQQFKGYAKYDDIKERYGNNFEEYYGKVKDAVDEVFEDILVYDDRVILSCYHAMSNGTTETAENVWNESLPYLKPVESEGDLLNPRYEEDIVYTEKEAENLLKSHFPDIKLINDKSKWFNILENSDSGYVKKIKVGDTETTGPEVRKIFDLRSACFDITFENEQFTFTTKGYGHGVGLSQVGSDFLARQGKSYDEILLHYFTDAEIKKAKTK
ncbi:MAG: stage II sporulation protein D [Oscillospiraceae bacterium]